MLRNSVLTSFLVVLGFAANGQLLTDNALGLRFGGDDGVGLEINYQRVLLQDNRLELGVGWRDRNDGGSIQLVGLYQLLFYLGGDFHAYLGGGGGFNSTQGDGPNGSSEGLFVSGNAGVEYSFQNSELPLQVSLDIRPRFAFSSSFDNVWLADFGLSLRYQF